MRAPVQMLTRAGSWLTGLLFPKHLPPFVFAAPITPFSFAPVTQIRLPSRVDLEGNKPFCFRAKHRHFRDWADFLINLF